MVRTRKKWHNKCSALVTTFLIVSLVFVLPTTFSFGGEAQDPNAGQPIEKVEKNEAAATAAEQAEADKSVAASAKPAQNDNPVKVATGRASVAAAGDATITIDNPLITMTHRDNYVVTVEIEDSAVLNQTDADNAAAALDLGLALERNAQDSPWLATGYDKIDELYNADRVYTGDMLANWKVWSTSTTAPAAPLFAINNPVVTYSTSGKYSVKIDFSNDYFFGNATNTGNRNVITAMIGDYNLNLYKGASATPEKIATATDKVKFNLYESYTPFSEMYEKLLALKPIAEGKGYQFDISIIGTSEGGLPQYAVVFGKAGKADAWKAYTNAAEKNPASKLNTIDADLANLALPLYLNNVHPDECPGSDSILKVLTRMVKEDTIPLSWIDGYQNSYDYDGDGVADVTGTQNIYDAIAASQMIPDQVHEWATPFGRYPSTWEQAGGWGTATQSIGKQGTFDANALYTYDSATININTLLNDVFFIMTPNENPDGRAANSRRNYNGFDLNRDGSFQTQAETQNLEPFIASWNPIIMDEYHGYTGPFLIEPCTPPHEQNQEYDLLVENFLKGGQAFGNAAIGSVQATYPANIGTGHDNPGENGINFSRYWIPLRDGFDAARDGGQGDGTWYAWDDLSTSYGPSYAMINCGSLGYTVEIDFNVEGCVDLLVYGTLGHAKFMKDNKKELLSNQLKFFKRGVDNEDVSDAAHALAAPLKDADDNTYAEAPLSYIESFYVDDDNNIFEDDLWRPKFTASGENNKFFPEFYVLPVDPVAQRDPADAAAITEYLIRNDVALGTLKADTAIDGTTYKAGSVIVDMHQAKRNYANAVLWRGIDASFYSGLYSESVVNFPEQRGFTVVPVAKASANAAIAGKVNPLVGALKVSSTLGGNTTKNTAVIIKNNSQEASRAVNALLSSGKTVGFIETGANKGNFIVDKATYDSIKGTYTLVGAGVNKAGGDVYKIKEPKVYLTGYQPGTYGTTNSNPYWKTWFANGTGSNHFYNNQSNEAYAHDEFAYQSEFGFKITHDPNVATIFAGSTALSTASGHSDVTALAKIKAGAPYIATGASPLSNTGPLKTQIMKGLILNTATTSSSESLHHIVFQDDSPITAPKKAQGDDVIYNYGGGRITKAPKGSTILYKSGSISDDFHIAGCFPNVSDANLGDEIEAINYIGKNSDGDSVDVTIFANSVTRKAHQQDDTILAATTIFQKSIDKSAKLAAFSGNDTPPVQHSEDPTAADAIAVAKTPVAPGKTAALPKTLTFPDGTTADVTWTSSDTNVVKIVNGNVVGSAEGKATLTATSKDGKKHTITVTIAKPVTSVRMSLTKLYLQKGKAFTPPAAAYSTNAAGKADTAAKLTWQSSNPAVASVDAATGKISPKKAGTASITATALNGKKLTISVKVVAKATALKKVTISKAPKKLKVGASTFLKVKLTKATATNALVKFKSSKSSIVSVDKAGKVTALKKGSAKITVSVGKNTYSFTIKVSK